MVEIVIIVEGSSATVDFLYGLTCMHIAHLRQKHSPKHSDMLTIQTTLEHGNKLYKTWVKKKVPSLASLQLVPWLHRPRKDHQMYIVGINTSTTASARWTIMTTLEQADKKHKTWVEKSPKFRFFAACSRVAKATKGSPNVHFRHKPFSNTLCRVNNNDNIETSRQEVQNMGWKKSPVRVHGSMVPWLQILWKFTLTMSKMRWRKRFC